MRLWTWRDTVYLAIFAFTLSFVLSFLSVLIWESIR